MKNPDRLYELLPAVHRRRDAERGFPLRALLRVITEQVNVVEGDIDQLYKNWFIETCEDWVVPYLGDLIGHQLVREAGEPGEVRTAQGRALNKILMPRREVANTIRNRRRKGTLALLELLANDVAGWPARAVEFYSRLGATQPINQLKLDRGRLADVRQGYALDLLDGPFDGLAHTVDVRRMNSHRTVGRHNIPSVGLFVWRLKSYSVGARAVTGQTNPPYLEATPACCVEDEGPECYTFSALGNDTPLYVRSEPEPEPTHIAEELNVPAPIRRHPFEDRSPLAHGHKYAQASADYYGLQKSLAIWAPRWAKKAALIPRGAIIPADLTDWHYRPPRGHIAVDPKLGRIAFPPGQLPPEGVWVYYHYAFSADIGGGEYSRSLSDLSIATVSAFHEDHILDLSSLVKKLRAAADPVSKYVQARLSDATRALLERSDGPASPANELSKALVAEMNQLLYDESLYDDDRVALVPLSDEVVELAGRPRQGDSLVRLNRLLMEAAYPSELVRSHAYYSVSEPEGFGITLTKWANDKPRHAIIELSVSGVYTAPIGLQLGPHQTLQIRAANRIRPVIRLLDYQSHRPDALAVDCDRGSRLTLDGLLITGRGVLVRGREKGEEAETPATDEQSFSDPCCDDAQLVVRHCTLVPGWGLHCDCEPQRPAEPSLELLNFKGRVRIEHSIVGSIQVQQDQVRRDPIAICVGDSVLDATSPEREALAAPGCVAAHAVLTIARSTVLGRIQTHAIKLAENCLFMGMIGVARRQIGCVRFCYVPPESRTPRRYHCQPDLAAATALTELGEDASKEDRDAARARESQRVEPQFNSVRYGTPTYGQLAETCATEILRGADDESEMGVWHDLFQPQRHANLLARLDEYTPAGMNAGIIYAS